MKQPFLLLGLSFAAGILLQQMAGLPITLLIGILPILFILLWHQRGRAFFILWLGLASMTLGALGFLQDSKIPEARLNEFYEKLAPETWIALTGVVASEPQSKESGAKIMVSFALNAESAAVWKPKPVRIHAPRNQFFGKIQIFLGNPGTLPEIGDGVRIFGQMKKIPPVLNPGGFDYARYLADQDMHFIFNAYGKNSLRILEPAPQFSGPRLISKLRKEIGRKIESLFQAEDSQFVKALILGEKKNLPSIWKHAFLKTGTSHLLAISGLNIALAVGTFYLLLIICYVEQKTAAFLALLATGLQVLVAGAGIPVQRAGLMAAAGFLSILLNRERNGLNLFFLAFWLLLIVDTRYLFNVSFQLSFLSLLCLMLFPGGFLNQWPWAAPFLGSIGVLAGTFPLVVYHFQLFSPMGLIANLLAIPLFHLALLGALGTLTVSPLPWLAWPLAKACHFFLQLALQWIWICSQADWGYFFIPKPGLAHLAAYYGFLVLSFFLCLRVLLPVRTLFRGMIFIAWGLTSLLLFIPPPAQAFELHLLSAGANEMIYFEFGRQRPWLIHTGRTRPSDQAEWVLLPFLRSRAVKKLQGVILTDSLKRHTSGLETLQHEIKIRHLVYTEKEFAVPGKLIQAGMHPMPAGGRMIFPQTGEVQFMQQWGKKACLVRFHNLKILFLQKWESKIPARIPKASILILPRKQDISKMNLPALLEKIQPRVVLSPQKIDPVASNRPVLWFNTQEQGAIRIAMGKGSNIFEVKTWLGRTFEIPLKQE